MLSIYRLFFILIISASQAVMLMGCANDDVLFVLPADRPLQQSERAWSPDNFVVLAYHDVEDEDPDQTTLAVRTNRLVDQLAWLRENDYRPVSVDQILAASHGKAPLPAKAVLLSFDDGYSSFYTHVFPLLKAYQWPAVLAPVGKWLDTPPDQPVDYGGKLVDHSRFLTWAQVKEMSDSGLVEIASHSYDLHKGVLGNPQGNTQPAATTRIYDPIRKTYENDAQFSKRIENDVHAITSRLRDITGKQPRVWIWPYGGAGGTALNIVQENGYSVALKLGKGLTTIGNLESAPRVLVAYNPTIEEFAKSVTLTEDAQPLRVMHVDLDYVYDDDPEQMERNVGKLVQRVFDMGVNTVFLQAFADPDGDGLVKSLYFPNRHLPVRADLFNRVSWQLRTRADVEVYAWMPVLAFDLKPSMSRVQRWNAVDGKNAPDPEQYVRLSPFDPNVRQAVTEIYEDLAKSAVIDGILFHDDAVLSDHEDVSPPALKAYAAAGLPINIHQLQGNPDALERWTRFKSRALVAFTQNLAKHVRAIQEPNIKTARNIYAVAVLNPDSEAWFAQNLDDFLEAYDWTVPMAMPLMEGIPLDKADAWLGELVDTIRKRPGALKKTVFEIQARDWKQDQVNNQGHIPAEIMTQWLGVLQEHGAQSIGYYPDDFVSDQPPIKIMRPAISGAWYPHP